MCRLSFCVHRLILLIGMILKLITWTGGLTHLFKIVPGSWFFPHYNHFHLSMPLGSVKLCK